MTDTRAEYDDFFRPLDSVLTTFAKAHSLCIEKYYHDAAAWSLCFRHPAGGHAKVDVSRLNSDEVEIQGVWWIDDYDSFTRHLKWSEKTRTERTSSDLFTVLGTHFNSILAWRPGEWTQSATGYEPHWKPFTRAQFASMEPQWPLPKT